MPLNSRHSAEPSDCFAAAWLCRVAIVGRLPACFYILHCGKMPLNSRHSAEPSDCFAAACILRVAIIVRLPAYFSILYSGKMPLNSRHSAEPSDWATVLLPLGSAEWLLLVGFQPIFLFCTAARCLFIVVTRQSRATGRLFCCRSHLASGYCW
jgi:hypothetical protein